MYLDVFNKVVDSDDFTVGGGSASALAGAMAAGMASMVAKLSMAKPVNLTQEEYTAMSKELDELAQTLLKGSEQDTDCLLYTSVSNVPSITPCVPMYSHGAAVY